MNQAEQDDDFNLDEAMYMDRMAHLQVLMKERIEAAIENIANEIFLELGDNNTLTHIEVHDHATEVTKKQVLVDCKLYGIITTRVVMNGNYPDIEVDFSKSLSQNKTVQPSSQNVLRFVKGGHSK